RAMGLIRKKVEATQVTYAQMAATVIDAATYFTRVFPAPERLASGDDDKYDEKLARWTAHQQRLLQLYTAGQGSDLPGVRGTAWAAYNAVTEWVDHHYPLRGPGRCPGRARRRFSSGTTRS